MKTETQPIDSLLRLYREAAAAHGEASSHGDFNTANKQHEIIANVYRELRKRGRNSQLALLPLLNDPNVHVRVWSAAHALEFSPAEGEATLEELSLHEA